MVAGVGRKGRREKPKPQPQQHVANPSSRLEESLEPDEACLREMAAFFRPENERPSRCSAADSTTGTQKYYN